jgi:hypothetical protein
MKTLLWLDDYRNPMEGQWLVFSPISREDLEVHWVKSYDQFVEWIEFEGLPDAICFDHDLGLEVAIEARSKGMSKRKSRLLKQDEKTGLDCAKWLVDYCIDNKLPLPLYNIQSANPVGKENIDKLLKNYIKSL